MRPPTRIFPPQTVLAILGALLAPGAFGCGEPTSERPNVVVIVVDSLRADHLDHLGYPRPTASPLDGFRDESVLFSDASAPSPWTLPSVASLVSGWFPTRHGVVLAEDGLDEGVVTLAEQLQAQGYTTAALIHHPAVNRESGFGQGFQRFESARGEATNTSDVGEMLPWLREWLATVPGDQPFFLYLHAMNTHGPYRVPDERRGMLLGHPPDKSLTYLKAIMRGLLTRPGRVAQGDVQAVVDQYDTAIRYSLDRIAELLRLLDRNGSYDDTLVVLAGDHGEELLEHGLLGHGHSLYEASLRVPLYIRPPGGTTGRTLSGPVSLLDVVPTVLALLDAPALPGDGISLAPQIETGAELDPSRALFYHTAFAEPVERRAVVEGRYKLVETRRNGVLASRRLRDLSLDPGESEDRSAQGAEVTERLTIQLREAFLGFRSPLEANRAASPGSEGR